MFRRTVIIFVSVLFMLMISQSVSAYTDNVRDYSELLTADEEKEIQDLIQQAVDSYSLDIAIVTTHDTGGKSSMEFADDYYDYNGYGIGDDFSGLLLLINIDAREIWISTTGKAIAIFTDERLSQVLDAVYLHLAEGEYYQGCIEFVAKVEHFARAGVPQEQHEIERQYPVEELVQATYMERVFRQITSFTVYAAALIIAVIATIVASRTNKGKVTICNQTYEEKGSFQMSTTQDDYIREMTTRVKIAASSTSAGGRGSSSTHRGSSGRTHGGGGRKF